MNPDRKEAPGVPERTTRPLARRFTYRYSLALVGFVALAAITLTTFNRTLDRVEQATAQVEAIGDQASRAQRIAGLAPLASAEPVVDGVDQSVSVDRARDDLSAELQVFLATHRGLTEGRGTSGLTGPSGALVQFWEDPDEQRAETLSAFHQEASTLVNLLAAGGEDRERIDAAIDFLQGAAEPVNGPVTTTLRDGLTEYSAHLESEIRAQREIDLLLVIVTVAMAAVALFVLFRPMARRIQLETTALAEAERVQRENNDRQIFRNQLVLGLERASSEEEIFDRVAAALREGVPDQPAELLLADSTHSHLREVSHHTETGSPNCPVDDPSDCVAIARGHTVRFETSRALDVCPKLPRHAQAPCSAVCAPVRFLGQPLGVLHTTGPDLHLPDQQLVERINVIANETGNRLGTLRATRETRLQASTDGLTGLANRRSLEAAAEELIASGRPFSVAIADLDHFKDLNDTFGHEAGDRALRLFARTLRANLRPDDLASRYGGEEFVLLLPNTSTGEARRALDRLRVTLAGDIAAAGIPPFTASWGLGTSESADGFSAMMQLTDEALYAAKRAGRNRVVTVGEDPASGRPAPDQIVLTADGSALRMPAQVACGTCGFENPGGSRYCVRCGTGLSLDDPPATSDPGSTGPSVARDGDADGGRAGGDRR